MAKIAQKKPGITKRPVYVTKDIYEIFYSKPQSLGKIHNVRGYWYTADGKRFASSHDAMNYLVTMLEAGKPVMGQFDPSKIRERVIRRVLNTSRKSPELVVEEADINQNHPAFQQFLEFVNWQARLKAERSGAVTSISKVVEQ